MVFDAYNEEVTGLCRCTSVTGRNSYPLYLDDLEVIEGVIVSNFFTMHLKCSDSGFIKKKNSKE